MPLVKLSFLTAILVLAVAGCYAQDASDPSPPRIGGRGRLAESMDIKTMLSKQRAERDKRDHRQMLERGEEALRLVNQLETSYTQSGSMSPADLQKLESLQDVVEKIRKELGGDDEGEADDKSVEKVDEDPRPATVEDAFNYLQKTTVKLVDELKKTTRFTISVIAIQSSNSVIRVVKFLRLRK